MSVLCALTAFAHWETAGCISEAHVLGNMIQTIGGGLRLAVQAGKSTGWDGKVQPEAGEEESAVRVVFTCGGTAGHVNPALALAGLIQERQRGSEVLFVGANRGIERRLIETAGYPFRAVEVSSFHRSLKPGEIKHNLVSLKNLVTAPRAARKILREFRPDLVVGTGGYASYPMVKAASAAGVPTAVHESNAIPGLTTRLLEPCADVIMVGFEDCRKNYRHPDKVVVTGTPVRGEFFSCTREQAKERLGVDDGKPLVVSFWGSLGAAEMNREMVDFIAREIRANKFHHIHGAGVYGYQAIQAGLRDRGIDLSHSLMVEVREYIYDMALVMRAADLVICRAGASTISELTALGVPAIIVPSPNVTNNHQEKNARVLSDHGAALLLLERDSSGQRLFQETEEILSDGARREEMGKNMASLGIPDAGERIYETVTALLPG